MNQNLMIVATLAAKAGSEARLRDALIEAVPKFRNEPGCNAYTLLEDRKAPGRFMTYETWENEAALATHMTSSTMKELEPTMKEVLDGDIKQDFLTTLIVL